MDARNTRIANLSWKIVGVLGCIFVFLIFVALVFFPAGERIHISPEPLPVCISSKVEIKDEYPERHIIMQARMYKNATTFRHRTEETPYKNVIWKRACLVREEFCNKNITSGLVFDCDEGHRFPDVNLAWRMSNGRDTIIASGQELVLLLAAWIIVMVFTVGICFVCTTSPSNHGVAYIIAFTLIGTFVLLGGTISAIRSFYTGLPM